MKAIKFLGTLSTAIIFLINISVSAQEKPDSSKTDHKMMKDSSHHMMMDMKGMKEMKGMKSMKHESSAKPDSSVTQKDEIDLTAIDENKDGKVYQCQMDFDVLSDKPGTDPRCGMKLEEVSLKKAKENLLKNGFKVK